MTLVPWALWTVKSCSSFKSSTVSSLPSDQTSTCPAGEEGSSKSRLKLPQITSKTAKIMTQYLVFTANAPRFQRIPGFLLQYSKYLRKTQEKVAKTP
jgi:hypothetical protein